MARYSVDYLMEWPTWPTEWIMQSILMMWNDFLYTGDTSLLQRHYSSLHARTLSALSDSTGLISTKNGKQTKEFLKSIGFRGKAIRDIVDWPQSGALGIEKTEAGEADGYELTTYNTVVNAYHYKTLIVISEIAMLLNQPNDADKYREQAEAVKKCFNELLFDYDKKCYRDGIGSTHYSLHANMFPLAFGLVPENQKANVCEFIQSRGMACSVYGSQFLLDAHLAESAFNGLQSHDIARNDVGWRRSPSVVPVEVRLEFLVPCLKGYGASQPNHIIPAAQACTAQKT